MPKELCVPRHGIPGTWVELKILETGRQLRPLKSKRFLTQPASVIGRRLIHQKKGRCDLFQQDLGRNIVSCYLGSWPDLSRHVSLPSLINGKAAFLI